jgi:hypothetical protein
MDLSRSKETKKNLSDAEMHYQAFSCALAAILQSLEKRGIVSSAQIVAEYETRLRNGKLNGLHNFDEFDPPFLALKLLKAVGRVEW